ncbi:ABC transporter ATP-binding protein [Celerinatantimonas yamalensis]|uniref:ABC transporter ATP-binding protein n=1 Tax=Celerinatantimonas yamalensis TaxID=559956 RepID=A0ABW9G565_9GAMM
MLEVSKLMRKYGRFTAVKDASFTIEQGEIVGLLGHNGAGKTTILKMLSGYLEPHHGQVQLNGISVNQQPKIAQQMIGYLPENLPIYPEMQVIDYLDYAATLKAIPSSQQLDELRRVIKATDLSDKLLAPIGTLSRGYKQRVGVAQALLGQPRFLILDEPTNGLDPTQTAQMRQLILEVAKQATVILSTHIMQEVEAICDRVLIIRAGEVAMDAKLADLKQSHRLELETSLPLEALRAAVNSIAGIAHISQVEVPIHHRYHIELNNDVSWQEISSQLAHHVTQIGDLYALQPTITDLETLFRQVNQQPLQHQQSLEGDEHAE